MHATGRHLPVIVNVQHYRIFLEIPNVDALRNQDLVVAVERCGRRDRIVDFRFRPAVVVGVLLRLQIRLDLDPD